MRAKECQSGYCYTTDGGGRTCNNKPLPDGEPCGPNKFYCAAREFVQGLCGMIKDGEIGRTCTDDSDYENLSCNLSTGICGS